MLSKVAVWLLDPAGLTPHGFCLLWQPGLIWTYAGSDLAIGIAYFTIPIALVEFARHRPDPVFRPILWMFAAFIMLCGASHWLDLATLWVPAYGLEAIVKASTAVVSLVTAIGVWRLLPHALQLPSRARLQEASDALLESKEKYRLSFEHSPVALYTLDSNDIVTAASNSFLRLLDYSKADVVGRWIGEFRAVGSLPRQGKDRQILMQAGEMHDLPRTFLTRDGTPVETLVSIRLDRMDGGEIALCAVIDVTARRKAEQALEVARAQALEQSRAEAQLRQSNAVLEARLQAQQMQQETEARFNFATQAGRLGVWELDLQIGELTASAMCKEGFGRGRDDAFTYTQMEQAIHADDRKYFCEAIAASQTSQKDFDGEFHIVRPDGSEGWIQLHAQAIAAADSNGVRLAGISLDITERVLTEIRIRNSQRVEAVGRLTAGVAHDFNNVLQALLGGLELAIAEVGDPPELRADLEFALKAGQRGAKLTSHLLSFSRQQILTPAAVRVATLLNDLSSTLRRTLGSDIRLELELAANLPDVYVDAAHLDSALLNLALNARDAMPNGGVLRFEASVDDGHIMIAVTNNGTGMTPGVLAQACEPFFTTKGVLGSGLGLSVVEGFARQSGGELRMQSTIGSGTRAEMRLPVAQTAANAILPVSRQQEFGSGRVLLVDDQLDVARVTAAFLRKSGYAVSVVLDGEAALAELEKDAGFDAVIADYAMPAMNGSALLRHVRKRHPDMPALMITGYASSTGLDSLPPDVMVLRKPFEGQDLIRRVKALIEDNTNGVIEVLL